ncbi:peptidoglycan-binding protein [Leucobacter sp. wl10]|uniref:peptidoglycan-binding domain-containing protein n=1 Tax=Leucobacter sp. wl10 TaxID=2304677 RepID=UPI000E5A85E9|nr:peptidoglycan-binding protein [Leucobacter sp. wl10]RGE19827.1 peptidoglycan-binding protein [Leucobacter sp. wl10]
MKRPLVLLATLSTTVLVSAAALLGWSLRPIEPPENLGAGSEPKTGPAVAQEFADERSVQVRLRVGDAIELTTAATGILTSQECAAGKEVTSGSILATIDYAPVFAIHTQSPLYRDLALGDRGKDVEVLQTELTRIGFAVEATGYFGWDTANALHDMKVAAGGPNEDSSYRLRISEYVWLRQQAVTASRCPAKLGQQISPGTPLATGPGSIQSIAIEPLPTGLAQGDRTLTVLGAEGVVGGDGVSTDPTLLAGVLNAPEAASVISDPASSTLPGRIRLVTPVPAVKVPPAAVFGVSGDRGCIRVGGTTHLVTVIGSSLGNTLVVVDEDVKVETVDLTGTKDASCPASEEDAKK